MPLATVVGEACTAIAQTSRTGTTMQRSLSQHSSRGDDGHPEQGHRPANEDADEDHGVGPLRRMMNGPRSLKSARRDYEAFVTECDDSKVLDFFEIAKKLAARSAG